MLGQEVAVRILRNAVARGRLAHAYLFAGPRGSGKTTLAKILAQAANCRQPIDGEPCGVCPECLQTPMHTVEMDAASNRGIDEIRDLREKVRFTPVVGVRRTYILDEAHMLTPEAFNALLKTLEEPPEHLLFILATTEPERIPDTVLSRCQKIMLRRLSVDEIRDYIVQVARREGVEISREAAEFLARRAEGSLRDALALLDLCITFADGPLDLGTVSMAVGGVHSDMVEELFGRLIAGDGPGFLERLHGLIAAGADVQVLAEMTLDLLRRRVEQEVTQRTPGVGSWLRHLDRMIEAVYQMRTAGDPELVFEAAALAVLGQAAQESQSGQNMSVKEGRTVSVSEPFDLDRLRALVRQKDIKTHALLEKVRVEMRGADVVLRFAYPSHRIRAEEEEHRERIVRSIREIMGKEVSVTFSVEGAK